MSIQRVVLCLVILAAPVVAAEPSWQQQKDEFLGGSRLVLDMHCQRGQQANVDGISAFNDDWVKRTRKLRFEAGVDPEQGSGAFFAGLSAAMHQVCPQVW